MEKRWTDEQRQVMELRGRNLLVSAAAGSGKTAVLVERIIRKITDAERPVDIDQLLVVTFTNAAAAEMRERIGLAIGKALEEQPDSVHLQRQQTLLHNAQITTIHSFCLFVIRNYFHRIEMDPDFRVAEEGELKLLKSDVMDGVLQKYYEEADPQFLALSETIATGKTDQPLKDTILKLFSFAMSYPWAEEWLEGCRKPFHVESLEELEALPLAEALEDYLGNLAAQWARQMRQCCQISLMEDGPNAYAALLQQEAEAMEKIAGCRAYQEYYRHIRSLSFGRLPALRKFAGDLAKKERVQKLRNEVKASVKKISEQFFFQSPEQMVADIKRSRPAADMLIEVTLAFGRAFSEKKREKNMLDFNDLEHFALRILVDEETHAPSRTAEELRRNYEEIMIDEYQDSNNVQEAILRAVSAEAEGGHNIFMVGDVKQSIYRFRMARPELFMEKYNTYTLEESENQRVDLHKNFRSRPQVLETVNDIFSRIMCPDIGDIAYDEKAALFPGAAFPEGEPGMFGARLLVIDSEEDKTEEKPYGVKDAQASGQELKAPELEARAVGTEIRRMMEAQLVKEEGAGGQDGLRPLRYSDIVILLRSLGSWADTFVKVLGEMGIPVRAASGTGYFSALEVQTALNLLKILDNPRQDIPLAAVLASPIVGLTGEELAIIRVQFPEEEFFQAVMHYMPVGQGAEPETEGNAGVSNDAGASGLTGKPRQKLQSFLLLLQKYRRKISYTPIHQLLFEILEETGYQAYVYALPGGEVKKANLEMLVEKAIAYENTSYRGLFHFIRYMEQLQKYEVDFPVADGDEAGAGDVVRVMSIHRSKGLEFPIVFVSGLGRMFNNQDVRERVVLHPRLGIGMDAVDWKRRLRTPGLTRRLLARKAAMENTGEELRILYVALTRAKEKLILTGVLKKAEEKLEELGIAVRTPEGASIIDAEASAEIYAGDGQGAVSFLKRLNASTFLQFILMACAAYPGKYPAILYKRDDLALAEAEHEAGEELTRIELLARLRQPAPEWEEKVAGRLGYVYPYEEESTMRTKVSVSELKHRAMDRLLEEEMADRIARPLPQGQEEHYVPAFMDGVREENMGAKRGTAMHRVLECYDFTREPDSLEEQLCQMREQKKIEGEMLALVSLPDIRKFLESSLGERMQQAAHAGKLYREKPFVMGKPAKEALEESGSEELLLIQGIIDVFFEEEDGIVLLDYKTDSVRNAKELADRYRTQMELYQEAVERALGKKVKEKILYSFCLDEEVIWHEEGPTKWEET